MTTRYSTGRSYSYFAGAITARVGDEASGPALMLAGYAVTGSAARAAALLAGLTAAAAVGGPVLGACLDRSVRPGRVLAGALVLYAAGLTAVFAGLGRLPAMVTVLVAVCTGLLGPALSGGWTGQLPRVVTPERLPRANALDAMTFSAASLTGPALAGTAADSLGPAAAVAVSVLLVALAAPAAWRLPPGTHRPGTSRPAPMTAALAAGVRCIAGNPWLARATAVSVVSCVAQGMLAACVPLLGERYLGGTGRGAMLLSGTALSALLANAVLARRPHMLAPDTLVWAGALVQGAGLVLAATGVPVLLLAAAVVVGLGEGPQLTALFAIRHREAPDGLRGQVFTTGASLKITGFAVGAAVGGPAGGWSLPGALALAAGVQVLAVLAHFALRPVDVT